jgi:hydrogenase nickel incorporation protein HypB
MTVKIVPLARSVLAGNAAIAARNRERFDRAGVLAVNVIAAPGAGKTSLIVRTLAALAGRARVGVIEGDIAGSIDAERVLAAGAAAAVQINTGGGCHLEAGMVRQCLAPGGLGLEGLDLVFIENVGNLVCPAQWDLGEHLKLCLLSAAEGHDKPVKYPDVFAASDVIVLNKIDLIELVDFEREEFYRPVRALNPAAPVFEVSCRTGAGLPEWTGWLLEQRRQVSPAPFAGASVAASLPA